MWVLAATLLLAASAPRLDPHHLPALPNRGLIRQERSGVALETLRGAPLGRLAGFRLASRIGIHGAVVENTRHRLYAIDIVARRIRPVLPTRDRAPAGCHFTDAVSAAQLYVCGRTIKSRTNDQLRVVARAPSPEGGGWHWAEYARPHGTAILAQWYGLCESPTAFSIVGGKLHPYGARTFARAPESFALGWLSGRRAVVHFTAGVCGRGYSGPGVYAVPLAGRPRLLHRVPAAPPRLYAMWGG